MNIKRLNHPFKRQGINISKNIDADGNKFYMFYQNDILVDILRDSEEEEIDITIGIGIELEEYDFIMAYPQQSLN